MAKLKALTESPPPARGTAEQQLEELRNYIYRVTEELNFVLTHLDGENFRPGALSGGEEKTE